jgi:hypothetical protein
LPALRDVHLNGSEGFTTHRGFPKSVRAPAGLGSAGKANWPLLAAITGVKGNRGAMRTSGDTPEMLLDIKYLDVKI